MGGMIGNEQLRGCSACRQVNLAEGAQFALENFSDAAGAAMWDAYRRSLRLLAAVEAGEHINRVMD